ncbi:hypothetical protein ACNPMX_11735 [Stenotrophomonas maltophilia]
MALAHRGIAAMSKHTPGPWSWYTHNDHRVAIDGPDGAEVARAEEYGASAWIEVSEDDARLIAAAPTGLDAAVFVYERLLSHPVDSWRIGANGQQSLCVLRDFIADATGQTEQEVQEFYEAKIAGEA